MRKARDRKRMRVRKRTRCERAIARTSEADANAKADAMRGAQLREDASCRNASAKEEASAQRGPERAASRDNQDAERANRTRSRRARTAQASASEKLPPRARSATSASMRSRRSWTSYEYRYVEDGRVISLDEDGITTSEGQGYAMLRAVWSNDAESFERVWSWTKQNLRVRGDNLFAWKWKDGVLDRALRHRCRYRHRAGAAARVAPLRASALRERGARDHSRHLGPRDPPGRRRVLSDRGRLGARASRSSSCTWPIWRRTPIRSSRRSTPSTPGRAWCTPPTRSSTGSISTAALKLPPEKIWVDAQQRRAPARGSEERRGLQLRIRRIPDLLAGRARCELELAPRLDRLRPRPAAAQARDRTEGRMEAARRSWRSCTTGCSRRCATTGSASSASTTSYEIERRGALQPRGAAALRHGAFARRAGRSAVRAAAPREEARRAAGEGARGSRHALLPPQLAVVRRGVLARRSAAPRRAARLPAALRHALVPGEPAGRSAALVSGAVPVRAPHARDDLAVADARGVPRRRLHASPATISGGARRAR